MARTIKGRSNKNRNLGFMRKSAKAIHLPTGRRLRAGRYRRGKR